MGFRDLIGSLKGGARGGEPGDAAAVVDAAAAPPSTGPGAFGKAPSRADFVRVNAGAFSTAGLERWIEDGVEALVSAGLPLPTEPVDFFACGRGGAPACLGVLGPGRDKVGRSFPFALFAYVDDVTPALRSALVVAEGELLAAARASVAAIAAGDGSADVAEAARALPVVQGSAATALAALGSAAAAPLLHAMFPPIERPTTPTALAGVVATVIAAVRVDAKVTIELPAFEARSVAFWLELLRAGAPSAQNSPSWLWSRATARLLVSPGAPSKELFVELMRPGQPGARHWVIDVGEAADRAAASLPGRVADVLAREGSIAELCEAVARA